MPKFFKDFVKIQLGKFKHGGALLSEKFQNFKNFILLKFFDFLLKYYYHVKVSNYFGALYEILNVDYEKSIFPHFIL